MRVKELTPGTAAKFRQSRLAADGRALGGWLGVHQHHGAAWRGCNPGLAPNGASPVVQFLRVKLLGEPGHADSASTGWYEERRYFDDVPFS